MTTATVTRSLVLIPALALAACGSHRPDAVAPTPGSPTAAAPSTEALGPIPLASGTLDLAALFPDRTLKLEGEDGDAGDAGYAGSQEIVVYADASEASPLVIADLDRPDVGARVTTITVLGRGMASPSGVAVGTTAAEAAAALPGLACRPDGNPGFAPLVCTAAGAPGFAFVLDATTATLAEAPAATVESIRWTAPAGVDLRIAALPDA